MPDPREAVYDVLLAKRERAREAAKIAEAWAKYEAELQEFERKIGRLDDHSGARFRHLHSV